MSALLPYEGVDMPIPIRGIQIIVLCFVFEALAIIATILRIWSRRIIGSKFVLNDYAAFVALFLTTALAVELILVVFLGGEGRHIIDVGLKQLHVQSRVVFSAQMVWAAANCAVKISILHLYMTIFVGNLFRTCCFILMGFSTAYLIMTILIDFLICKPLALNWDYFVIGHCANEEKAYLYTAIINFLIDVSIVVLPMPLLWGLQMPLSRKLSLVVMFGLGAVICIITIVRITSIPLIDKNDITYSDAPLTMWTVLEPTLGIVNACLPAMRPALQRLFGSSGGFQGKKNGSTWVGRYWGRSTRATEGESQDSHRLNDFHRLNEYSYSIGNRSRTPESKEAPMRAESIGNNKGKTIKVTNAWEVQTATISADDLV